MYVADTKRLTPAGAKQMMATAIAVAERPGIAISVAIVDAGGHLLLLERMDGGRFHTVHSATTKAVCAASNRRATTAQGAQGQALDTAHAIGLALAAGAGALDGDGRRLPDHRRRRMHRRHRRRRRQLGVRRARRARSGRVDRRQLEA